MLTEAFNSRYYSLRLCWGGIFINQFYGPLYLFHTDQDHGTAVTPMSWIGKCVIAVDALLTLSRRAGTGTQSSNHSISFIRVSTRQREGKTKREE